MKDEKARVICLTPVKDEAWILDRFLQCASLWADHIVVADQQSSDGSRDIAARFPKVHLVENPGAQYSEAERQNILIRAARKIPVTGKRIFIALDADEALTANWDTSAEWHRILHADPGTAFAFQWVNVLPGFKRAWIPRDDKWFAFVDDGSPHQAKVIHSTRIPMHERHLKVVLDDIKVLHLQYVNWERMLSKQRWYQVWERLNVPEKRPITLYRQYHHMHAIPEPETRPIRREWLDGYSAAGIDLRVVHNEPFWRWDLDIIHLLEAHGNQKFAKLDIWDVNWKEIARQANLNGIEDQLEDPRSRFDRSVHRWLEKTQPAARKPYVRLVQNALRILGW